ncbi:MAG: hypothetical protein DRQ88_12240 [Epsilonproteobacteria bacterium]|nr:MAG: hypothetical protein DRQ88_12240 [Campylobacterota bacterium]RLA64255.1 MAG: hypothetical protein DRQ89_04665 [Campylobacterota bacterium]
MELKSIQKVVSRIQTSLFKNSNSFSVGMFKSHFKGLGLQFKEHQVYDYGDDIRLIDWKLLAKTSHPYIKTFEEERNVEIIVAIDASKSMFCGYEGVSKLQASLEICFLLYLLTAKTGDNVEAYIYLDKIIKIPKASGHMGISQFITLLEREGLVTAGGKLNLEYEHKRVLSEREIYISLMGHLRKKKEIILLSDFNDFLGVDELRKILYKSHLHCFQMLSPVDTAEKIPFSIYSSDQYNLKDGSLNKFNFKKIRDFESGLGKKFKRLKVEERYLEDFIKEMV